MHKKWRNKSNNKKKTDEFELIDWPTRRKKKIGSEYETFDHHMALKCIVKCTHNLIYSSNASSEHQLLHTSLLYSTKNIKLMESLKEQRTDLEMFLYGINQVLSKNCTLLVEWWLILDYFFPIFPFPHCFVHLFCLHLLALKRPYYAKKKINLAKAFKHDSLHWLGPKHENPGINLWKEGYIGF